MFERNENLFQHSRTCKKQFGGRIGLKRSAGHVIHVNDDFAATKIRSTFGCTVETWRILLDKEPDDVIGQFKDAVFKMKDVVSTYRYAHIALKFTMAVHIVYAKLSDSLIITESPICLVSEPFEVYADTSISEKLMNAYKQLLNEITVE